MENHIPYAISYFLELIGGILLAKNFISLKRDQLIDESSSGWFGPPNSSYIKRNILLKEETKVGIFLVLVGIFIKIIILLINESFHQIIIILISFILLYFIIIKLSNNLINIMYNKEANDIARKLITAAPKEDHYISQVAENLMHDISRGPDESDVEFAKRIRKKLNIHL